MLIHDQEFLLNTLFRAVQKTNNNEFAEFQLKTINELEPKINADYLTVNTIHINNKMELDGEIISFVANTSPRVVESYLKNMEHDVSSPVSFLNTGSSFFNDAFYNEEGWHNSKMYKNHCQLFGYEHISMVTYQVPYKKTTFTSFYYIKDKGSNFPSEITEEIIEFFSYPFYLGWLFKFGIICIETLKDWLSRCINMTLPRFLVLRALAGQGLTNSGLMAEELGLVKASVHRHIERSFKNLLERDVSFAMAEGNANRMVSLSQAYNFLKFGHGNLGRKFLRRKM